MTSVIFLLNVWCHMITNLHSFRKSGSGSMCSVVGKNPGNAVVKSSVGPMGAGSQHESKRLRRSEADHEAADPESDNGSEGSSNKGDKGRHSTRVANYDT